MDVVLVGLPGSGKSAVGRRLAHRHDAAFVDLDDAIERTAGRPIPTIFADDGEAAFRSLERAAVESLGEPDPDPVIKRVVATGGGAGIHPPKCRSLFPGRPPLLLDRRPEGLSPRPPRGPQLRPPINQRGPH